MHTSYPATTDIASYLTNAGFTLGALDPANALAAAVAEWERRTGWTPFLAESSASTCYYDSPRGNVMFVPGYTAIDSLAFDVTYDNTGTPSPGIAAVADYHYWPQRWRANDSGTPICRLRFRYQLLPSAASVLIVGCRGYSVQLADDIWQAVVEGCAARIAPQLLQALAGGRRRIAIGGRSVEYNEPGPLAWPGDCIAASVVAAYHRTATA